MEQVKLLNGEELYETILVECKKAAFRTAKQYGQLNEMKDDLEGFLIEEIYIEFQRLDSSFHNIRMIRRLIGFRTVDFIRDKARFDAELSFSDESHRDDVVKHKFSLENHDISRSSHIEMSDQYILSEHMKGFRATLTERQNQILDLVTEGYGTNEICEMLNISINTPRNTMKKIRELALDYGF